MTDLKSLSPNHYRILELVLQGFKQRELAAAVSMTEAQIHNVTSSPCFQHELALRRAQRNELIDQRAVSADQEVAAEIRRHTMAAAKKLGALVTSATKDADAIRAAEAILDRGGQPRVQRNESKSAVVMLNASDVALLKETLSMLEGATVAGTNQP